MAKSKTRRKTTSIRRGKPKAGEFQQLHIKVTSPRIVMHQLYMGAAKGIKCAVFIILTGLILYGGYRGVEHMFLKNEKYLFESISLKTSGHLDSARIEEISRLDRQKTIFDIDTDQVRKDLLALPEVVECTVERRLPGTLKITVVERDPIVWIKCESLGFPGRRDGGILMDESGVSYPCASAQWSSVRQLPVVALRVAKSGDFQHGSITEHKDLLRALDLIKIFNTADVRNEWLPEQVILINDYSMEVISHDGSRAVFGMYDHQRQLDDFISIREHYLKNGGSVEHVNLIPQSNIPVKLAGDPVLVKPKLILSP